MKHILFISFLLSAFCFPLFGQATSTSALKDGSNVSGAAWKTNLGFLQEADVSGIYQPLIADGGLSLAKLAQASATSGQVIKWNGSAWAPAEDTGGTVDNPAVNAAIEEAPAATRDSLEISDNMVADLLNWQPNTLSKLAAMVSPMRVLIAGDSLSSGLRPMPFNAAPMGVIGLARSATVTSVTECDGLLGRPSFEDTWLAPFHRIAVGGSAIYHNGAQGAAHGTSNAQVADKLVVYFIKKSGGGTFDLQVSDDGGSTWKNGTGGGSGTATNISFSNASTIGAAQTVSLVTSNSPKYLVRITNVTTADLDVIAVGLYQSTGIGAIALRNMANLAGIDVVSFGRVSDAIFTPIWTDMAPDLVLSNWADAPEDWDETKLALTNVVTNGTTTITFDAYPATEYANGNAYRPYPRVGDTITGTNIPAGTRIASHTKDSTTATLTQAASGSGTNSATIKGAFVAWYDRCKAIRSATDFVQLSTNPLYTPELAGHGRWITSTAYVIGDRVTMRSADGTLGSGESQEVYVCTSNHTSGASTKPTSGGSWATVWAVDTLDDASIAAGSARAKLQAYHQRQWADRDGETFINGFGMFRDYEKAVAVGLMSIGDQVHPTTLGHRFKNMMLWSKLPFAQINLGSVGSVNPYEPDALASHYLTFEGLTHPNAASQAILSLLRPLLIGGASAGMTLADRNAPNTGANNITLFNTDGNLNLGSTTGIGGISSYQGLHPVANGRMLGGRGSFWWNLGGAGLRLEYRASSDGSNVTVLSTDHTIHVTANSPTVILPDSVALNATVTNYTNAGAGAVGKVYCVTNTGAGTVTVRGAQATRTSGVTNGTTTITFASTGTPPNVGDFVTGTDIPGGAYVVIATATSAVLNAAATGSNTGITFTFTENIDAAASQSLTTGQKIRVQSTATGWVSL